MNWLTALQYLPELFSLVGSIQKHIKEVETDRKVSDDLKAIKKAFDEKDIAHLNDVFNSKLPVGAKNQPGS